jgi:hypothetical protein
MAYEAIVIAGTITSCKDPGTIGTHNEHLNTDSFVPRMRIYGERAVNPRSSHKFETQTPARDPKHNSYRLRATTSPLGCWQLEIFEMADRSSLATSMTGSLRSRPELTGEEPAAMFRKVADEFRQKAAASISETDRARWFAMAEEWQVLAKSAASHFKTRPRSGDFTGRFYCPNHSDKPGAPV